MKKSYHPFLETLETRDAPSPLTAADIIVGPHTQFYGTTREAVVAQLSAKVVNMDLSATDRAMIAPTTVVMVYPQSTSLPPCIQLPLPNDVAATLPNGVDPPTDVLVDNLFAAIVLAKSHDA